MDHNIFSDDIIELNNSIEPLIIDIQTNVVDETETTDTDDEN